MDGGLSVSHTVFASLYTKPLLSKFIAQDNATLGRRSSVSRTAQRSMYATRTGALIEEIGNVCSRVFLFIATIASSIT